MNINNLHMQDIGQKTDQSSRETEITTDNNLLVFECPSCLNIIQVEISQLNCCIFRHGVFKHTHEPINPHASKEECDILISKGLIFGCGKPFRIYGTDVNTWKAKQCDYI